MATKTEAGVEFPSAAYAYVPDAATPSTWKLRLWETPALKVTARQVGMAIAALGSGFRGNKVEIPSNDLAAVKRKVLTAWRSTHPDAKSNEEPEVLKRVSKEGDNTMTVEELSKKLEEMETELASVTKRAEEAEATIAANAVIAKLSDEDRQVFDAMPKEEQAAFVTADAEVQTTMLSKHKVVKSNVVPEEVRKELDAVTKRAEAAEARAIAAEEVAKSERDSRHMVELAKVAERDYAGLPGTPDEKAKVLKSLEKLTVEEQGEVTKLFKAGNACIAESMKSVGKSTPAGAGTSDVWSKIEKLADGIVAKDNNKLTRAQAINKVITDNPELYTEYLDEKKK